MTPHKLAQKDVDARWTKKNNTTFYGSKNDIKADTRTKLIEEYTVTDAFVCDSQAMEQLLTELIQGKIRKCLQKEKSHQLNN